MCSRGWADGIVDIPRICTSDPTSSQTDDVGGKEGLADAQIQTSLNSAILKEKPQLNDAWVGQSLIGRLSTADEFRGA